MLALVLVHQRLALGVGAADEVTLTALVFGVAGLAGLGLELAHYEATAGTVGVELAVGASGTEAGVAGAGFEQGQLFVFLDLVGRHSGAALVTGQLLLIGAIATAGSFSIPVLAGLGERGASLSLYHGGGTNTQNGQQGGGNHLVHVSEGRVGEGNGVAD